MSWRLSPLPLWALPVAATVLVACVMVWQVARAPVEWPAVVAVDGPADAQGGDTPVAEADGSAVAETDGSESRPYRVWGLPTEVVRPVLPPQAYWGMDAFEEWRSLRPGSGSRVPGAGDQEPDPRAGGRVIDHAADAVAARGLAPAGTPRSQAAEDELAWAPAPSGLPGIELSSIAPAPLEVLPLDEPPPITLSEITLEPIELAPFDEQEMP